MLLHVAFFCLAEVELPLLLWSILESAGSQKSKLFPEDVECIVVKMKLPYSSSMSEWIVWKSANKF